MWWNNNNIRYGNITNLLYIFGGFLQVFVNRLFSPLESLWLCKWGWLSWIIEIFVFETQLELRVWGFIMMRCYANIHLWQYLFSKRKLSDGRKHPVFSLTSGWSGFLQHDVHSNNHWLLLYVLNHGLMYFKV